ncbi:hypothetical protein OIM90_18770 [Streptomyces sp. AD16]|nr:hypothetical protein OIM90_18770 [Streptomyces sp. AD16]
MALLLPPVLLGSGWLAQSESTLLLLLGVIVAMAALLVSWAYAGAGPGTFVALFGLAFLLFVGPATGKRSWTGTACAPRPSSPASAR